MYWRFKSYEAADGANQPWQWYAQQDEGLQTYIWAQMMAISAIDEFPVEEFVNLTGRHSGLSQMPMGVETERGIRQIGLLGFWETDSPNFIVLLCSEIDTDNYNSLLERALRLKHEWDNGKGRVHEFFSDYDTNQFYS